jgi:hypothetical protein
MLDRIRKIERHRKPLAPACGEGRSRKGVSPVYRERHVRTGETPVLLFLGRNSGSHVFVPGSCAFI